jgi:hypothetical protein
MKELKEKFLKFDDLLKESDRAKDELRQVIKEKDKEMEK